MLPPEGRARTSTLAPSPMRRPLARTLVLTFAAFVLGPVALAAQAPRPAPTPSPTPSPTPAPTPTPTPSPTPTPAPIDVVVPLAVLPVPALTFDGAGRIAAAASEEAARNGWAVSIAVVDDHGELLFFARLDGASQQSVDIARAKARTAARWRRETKALEDAVAGGRTALVAVEGILPLEGGIPITFEGRVIGAVGVSGATSAQDAQIARAGIRAVLPQ